MSLSSTVSRNSYTGNGSNSAYSYAFRIVDSDDLLVTVRDTDDVETTLTKTTDYTVSGVGVAAGGNVTLVDNSQAWLTSGNLKSNYIITIRRVVDVLQATDIRNQGSFLPETHEDALDYLTFIAQQHQDLLDRSLKVAETIDPADFDGTLPVDVADHGNEYIKVNADGDGIAFGGLASDIPAYYVQDTPPSDPSSSSLAFWFDTTISQMKIWCRTEWRIIA